MKLIFISDIHANLPVFDAVWEEIQKHSPDNIFCLGDLVNFQLSIVVQFPYSKHAPNLKIISTANVPEMSISVAAWIRLLP